MSKGETLVFSLSAWLVAMGMYALIRFYGTAEVMDWMADPAAVWTGWIVVGLPLGLIFWLIELKGDSPILRKRAYGFIILVKVLVLLLSAIAVVFAARVLEFSIGSFPLMDLLPNFFYRLLHPTMLGLLLYITLVSFVLSFIRQMVVMNGRHVVLNLLRGMYRQPRVEDRVFMFLDLRSSTTFAEQLGNIRFSQLIQDCFADLTDATIKHDAELYQYVGDEAVLSWPLGKGLENNNCIHVFFDFQSTLEQREVYYRQKYDLVPEFKAGVNAGEVTVAEVGVIKREIAYHSDVLNTAARIQGKCNELGQYLLLSAQMKALLTDDPSLTFEPLGPIPLKGKVGALELIGVDKTRLT